MNGKSKQEGDRGSDSYCKETVLTMRGISEEQLMFHPNVGRGVRECRRAETAWWLDVKASSDGRLCCTGGYESILGFSLSMMPSSTTTHCKDGNV